MRQGVRSVLRDGSVEVAADWNFESATESDPDGFGITSCRLPSGMSTQGNLASRLPPVPVSAPQKEWKMRIVYPCCGGVDVHKKQVTACRHWKDEAEQPHMDQATFGTFTRDLQSLGSWFTERGVQHVAMEATGPYWRPVWNVLESRGLALTLANPAHIRAIPGHKTDRRDARWLADLHQLGLVPPSFVPTGRQRRLRDLTRMRSKVVQDRCRVVTRLQSVLEDANIKLASVASDVRGVSSDAMLRGLIAGKAKPGELADLAIGKLREKIPDLELALEGNFTKHHAFQAQRLLMQERMLSQQETALARRIVQELDDRQKQVIALWDTIPGVNETVATILAAELGTRPEQFPDADHAASWVAICPGNHQSAGKQKSGKTRKGNRWLRVALVEAAWAAARSKETYLAALYARLVPRKGEKRALVAVAHSILVSAYHMLKTGRPYQDLGPDFFARQRPQHMANNLVKKLTALGYKVEISPLNQTEALVEQ
jgi:transposase